MKTNEIVNENKYRLWYKRPAANWDEALPIGNGRLGGMIYGHLVSEHIQLNEDSIWYGDPVDRNNPDALKNLNKIRNLLFDGKIEEAENLAVLAFSGVPESQRPYQTMGDLFLHFDMSESSAENYTRELDIENAVVSVSFQAAGINYTRRYFSSAPDQVIVIHMSADKDKAINFTANLRRSRFLDTTRAVGNNTIGMYVSCGADKGVRFCTMLRAISKGGSVYTIGENLVVEGADSVTLLLSAATSFYHEDYEAQCINYLDSAEAKGTTGFMLIIQQITRII